MGAGAGLTTTSCVADSGPMSVPDTPHAVAAAASQAPVQSNLDPAAAHAAAQHTGAQALASTHAWVSTSHSAALAALRGPAGRPGSASSASAWLKHADHKTIVCWHAAEQQRVLADAGCGSPPQHAPRAATEEPSPDRACSPCRGERDARQQLPHPLQDSQATVASQGADCSSPHSLAPPHATGWLSPSRAVCSRPDPPLNQSGLQRRSSPPQQLPQAGSETQATEASPCRHREQPGAQWPSPHTGRSPSRPDRLWQDSPQAMPDTQATEASPTHALADTQASQDSAPSHGLPGRQLTAAQPQQASLVAQEKLDQPPWQAQASTPIMEQAGEGEPSRPGIRLQTAGLPASPPVTAAIQAQALMHTQATGRPSTASGSLSPSRRQMHAPWLPDSMGQQMPQPGPGPLELPPGETGAVPPQSSPATSGQLPQLQAPHVRPNITT